MLALNHSHITKALLDSTDDGETINLAKSGLTSIPDASVEELAAIGDGGDGVGIVTRRIALSGNQLTELPKAFSLLTRLRYLNLRQNAFTTFPIVLTMMSGLEILDISRNSITTLPAHPGNLVNLRVFSLIKNKLDQLPVYLSEFHKLRVFNVQGNPIVWPPKHVLDCAEGISDEEQWDAWIHPLQTWLSTHANSMPHAHDSDMIDKNDDILTARTLLRSDSLSSSDSSSRHGRSESFESFASSEYSDTTDHDPPSAMSSQFMHHPRTTSRYEGLSHSRNPSPPSTSQLAPPAGLLNNQHGRNASYSVGTSRSTERHGTLLHKKSLPEMRSRTYDVDRRNGSRPRKNSRTADTTVPLPERRIPATPSSSSLGSSSHIRPLHAQATPSPSDVDTDAPAAPVDKERNLYFRRLSKLPKDYHPIEIPPALLKMVDSIRGILFALSQIYSAVRNYTVSAIDERTSSALGKVLDPASSYLTELISALEDYDAVIGSGVPPPHICRRLLESCKDNVAVYRKVVGVLQLQLKVLASSHDARYTRTLLLMLYGSMAEISNSWQSMIPHIDPIRPLLRVAPPSNPSPTRPVISRYVSHSSSNSISEEDLASPMAASPALTNGGPRPGGRFRRQAGSFSSNDVQVGKTLVAHSAERSYSPGNVAPLRPIMRNPSATSTPLLSASASSSFSLSHTRSQSSVSSINLPLDSSAPISSSISPRMPPHIDTSSATLPLNSPAISTTADSSTVIDPQLMDALETATYNAGEVWSMLEEVLAMEDEPHTTLKEGLERVKGVTTKMQAHLASTYDGSDIMAAPKKTMMDDAHVFIKSIVQILVLLKDFSIKHTLPAAFRESVAELTRAVQDALAFLHVSSFALPPTPRPFSPATPAIGMSMGGLGQGGSGGGVGLGIGIGGGGGEETRSMFLSRSRSATGSQSQSARLMTPIQREVPHSALPHQAFRFGGGMGV